MEPKPWTLPPWTGLPFSSFEFCVSAVCVAGGHALSWEAEYPWEPLVCAPPGCRDCRERERRRAPTAGGAGKETPAPKSTLHDDLVFPEETK